MIRDTWRAILVVVVVLVLREILSRPAPPVQVPIHYFPAPAPVYNNQPQPPVYGNERPLRRIGAAVVELGDSVIGAIRR